MSTTNHFLLSIPFVRRTCETSSLPLRSDHTRHSFPARMHSIYQRDLLSRYPYRPSSLFIASRANHYKSNRLPPTEGAHAGQSSSRITHPTFEHALIIAIHVTSFGSIDNGGCCISSNNFIASFNWPCCP